METPQKSSPRQAQKPASIGLDLNFYQDMLDCPNTTDAQKQNLIEALSLIVISMVDLGIGIQPIQEAQETEKTRQEQSSTLQNFMTDFIANHTTEKETA